MSNLIKKENISIVIGEYTDQQTGQPKKQWRTIGELITMMGDDGQPYQFGKLWGAGGCVEVKVFEQDQNRAQNNMQQPQQQPQQQYGQPQANKYSQGGFAGAPVGK